MLTLNFGTRAALQVVETPDGQGIAVRLSSGRNALVMHLASVVAAELHRALEQYASAAHAARRLAQNREAGKPLDLAAVLQRMEKNEGTRADAARLREYLDRIGIRL